MTQANLAQAKLAVLRLKTMI